MHSNSLDCQSTKPIASRIGYARFSTVNQNFENLKLVLKKAGCSKIFSDCTSSAKTERPGWQQLMEYIQPGDTLVVTELSQMTYSLMHLLETVKMLSEREVDIVSLRENIDTSTARGQYFLSSVSAIDQMERELRAERAAVGRASARARGRNGGRPRTDPEKLEQARIMYENSNQTAAEVCQVTGVGRRTFFAYMAQCRKQQESAN